MASGEDCPMCADARDPVNDFSVLVAELPASYVRLSRNQTHVGYCLVIAKEHFAELHDMTDSEVAAFGADVAATSRAIAKLFSPVKLDHLSMGHRCPHVHVHVYPQYVHNDPLRNVDISDGDVLPNIDKLLDRARLVREHLASSQGPPRDPQMSTCSCHD